MNMALNMIIIEVKLKPISGWLHGYFRCEIKNRIYKSMKRGRGRMEEGRGRGKRGERKGLPNMVQIVIG